MWIDHANSPLAPSSSAGDGARTPSRRLPIRQPNYDACDSTAEPSESTCSLTYLHLCTRRARVVCVCIYITHVSVRESRIFLLRVVLTLRAVALFPKPSFLLASANLLEVVPTPVRSPVAVRARQTPAAKPRRTSMGVEHLKASSQGVKHPALGVLAQRSRSSPYLKIPLRKR